VPIEEICRDRIRGCFRPLCAHWCIKITYGNLQESVAAVNNEGLDSLIISLDLLSAIIQAIDPAKSDVLVVSAVILLMGRLVRNGGNGLQVVDSTARFLMTNTLDLK
jgi:hypothetical protein